MTDYHRMIIDATKCPTERAADVEEIMRVRHSTLDNLRRGEFRREARIAWKVYQMDKGKKQ
jgi:hypothetical protein